MSYPTIGMDGIVPDDKWTAKTIRKLLRDGHHIFEDDGSAHSEFDVKRSWWKPWHYVIHKDNNSLDEDRVFSFATFEELAAWVAFAGKDFL